MTQHSVRLPIARQDRARVLAFGVLAVVIALLAGVAWRMLGGWFGAAALTVLLAPTLVVLVRIVLTALRTALVDDRHPGFSDDPTELTVQLDELRAPVGGKPADNDAGHIEGTITPSPAPRLPIEAAATGAVQTGDLASEDSPAAVAERDALADLEARHSRSRDDLQVISADGLEQLARHYDEAMAKLGLAGGEATDRG